MAIGPLGNAIFINQNMHIPASQQTDQLNRYEIQNFFANEILKDKDKVIQEVRPTEEGHKISPDKEQPKEQEKKEQEKEEHKRAPKEESEPLSATPHLHLLDIKV